MFIKVKGKQYWISHEEMAYATRFMTSILFTKKFNLDGVQLDILRAPRKTCRGSIVPVDERTFRMVIDSSSSYDDQLMALGHELVHMRQYLTGQLWESPTETIWQGKQYSSKLKRGIGYWFLPWEVEAHGHEQGLLEVYLTHLQKHNLAFEPA